MTERTQHFGGPWSLIKVQTVAEYFEAYTRALSKATYFKRVYIDAFAGSGSFTFHSDEEPTLEFRDGYEADQRGSAKRALDAKPGFHEFYFVDTHADNIQSLRSITATESRPVKILHGDANDVIPKLLMELNWRQRRGVIFLDPFGHEARWPLLISIAATKALDVFFLFPLSSVYRNAPRQFANLTPDKRVTVEASLWPGWEEQLYCENHRADDLFGDKFVTRERKLDWRDIEKLVTDKMRSIFPHVEEPGHLYLRTKSPIFSLYFAVSNPSPVAQGIASRIAHSLLKRL